MAVTNTISGQQCHREVDGRDRHDQAIGRIIRLLPMLPVKELDALADRLGQRLGGSWNTNRPSIADRRETEHYDEAAIGPAMTTVEPTIDIVGH